MDILHLTQKDYKTSAWSGGTTTELFIWPQGASYAARQFQFRISSATVDLAESDFTLLPGVERYITPLSGGFTLLHPGKEPVVMGPLSAPYRFSGEETTHCVGKATDFNLMLKGVPGEMTLEAGRTIVKPGFNGFYATEKAIFTLECLEYPMEKGEMLVIFADSTGEIDLDSPTLCCYVSL